MKEEGNMRQRWSKDVEKEKEMKDNLNRLRGRKGLGDKEEGKRRRKRKER